MTERRHTSRAESQTPTKRPPPSTPSRRRRSSHPPPSGVVEHVPRATLSVAIVALGDIPTLLGPARTGDAAPPPSIAPLLAAVDGDMTVAELADRVRIDPEQARAIIAELVDRGIVALSRKTVSSSGVGTVRGEPRSLDYWLAGLKPRTK